MDENDHSREKVLKTELTTRPSTTNLHKTIVDDFNSTKRDTKTTVCLTYL